MEIFGPVRSRRFGMSLGINHLPPKACSYACVYCQLGRTNPLSIHPQAYSQPQEVISTVQKHLRKLTEAPDVITFVSNGEPSLDSKIGETIEQLRQFNIPIAVISNASMLWKPEVRSRLLKADILSLKVDTADEATWHKINRPHGRLLFEQMLEGMRAFAKDFNGRLLTESMLVKGLNDSTEQVQATTEFIRELQPEMAYLALPLRAPAEEWVHAPPIEGVNHAHEIFLETIERSALMDDLPETGLSASGDALQELLQTIKVHPMEQTEVIRYLNENHLPLAALSILIDQKKVSLSQYRDKVFYSIRARGTSIK